jgi:hypothetical protein
MIHTRDAHPEISDQLALNRQHLHLHKKYDPDSDEIQDIPPIQPHDYIFPMPDNSLINEYMNTISIQLSSHIPIEHLEIHNMIFAINQLKSGIDCRKYFF